jgi:hypothetical protein
MKLYSVFDPAFKPYGQVVTGLDDAVAQIMAGLAETPLPEGVGYVPTEPKLQNLPAADVIRDHCFGGMPAQLGWCNGHNTKLNCLEYHRDSEFNLGTEDFVLILGLQAETENGFFDTAKVKVFRVPKGVLVEVFATSLHYAPCHADPDRGFRVLVALPWLTNTDKPAMEIRTEEDAFMTARNKWLLAHPESEEAKNGARIGLVGENIDIADLI